MPRIVPKGATRIRRASRVQTLIAMPPSTLKTPLGAGLGGFVKLVDFIPKMPCFVLMRAECTPDSRMRP